MTNDTNEYPEPNGLPRDRRAVEPSAVDQEAAINPPTERPTARRATMRDVAKAAGVSLKTVSRVVNREPGVSDELVARVEQQITRLDYQRDDRARFLRRSEPSSQTIGFVQVDVANPFFSQVLRGLEDVARANGSLVLAGSSDGNSDREAALVRTFISRRVDGLVLVSCHRDLDFLRTEAELGTPVVFLDLDPAVDLGGVVRTDHYRGSALATEHLVAHGHHRIAFLIDNLDYSSTRLRLAGFRDVMTAAGLETPWIVSDLADPQLAYEATRALLKPTTNGPTPTAIFAAQNFSTMGAVRALHALNLQFDIALIGFDDIELADVFQPGISVVCQQPRNLGRIAGELIFRQLNGGSVTDPNRLVPAELIPRGSGELPGPHGR